MYVTDKVGIREDIRIYPENLTLVVTYKPLGYYTSGYYTSLLGYYTSRKSLELE